MVYTALTAKSIYTMDWDAVKTSVINGSLIDTSMMDYAVYWLNRSWWNNFFVAGAISMMYGIFFTCWIVAHNLD